MELSDLPHQIRKTAESLSKDGRRHKWTKERMTHEIEARARYGSWNTRTEVALKAYMDQEYQ